MKSINNNSNYKKSVVDLHMHTTYSDGEYTNTKLLKMCERENMSYVAITDHNNFMGVKDISKLNLNKDIVVFPGIEFSSKYTGGQCHILGYGFDLNNKELNEVCSLIVEDSKRKLMSLVENLYTSYHIKFKDEDLNKIFSQVGNVGRPHIAKLCVEYGYTKTTEEAFKKVFDPIKDKVVKRRINPTPKECINYILNAGGVVSLAHAITLKKNDEDLFEFVKELTDSGMQAIEVYHSKHSLKFSSYLLKVANKLGLLVSGGSDFHGPYIKPTVKIGNLSEKQVTRKDLTIIDEILRRQL